jgi:GH25 family lysozyme M1 (1,4-beta-N-acetylmuramidase)
MPSLPRLPARAAALTTLALATLALPPAAQAAPASTASAATRASYAARASAATRADHAATASAAVGPMPSNVAQTHSPQLLRALAGPPPPLDSLAGLGLGGSGLRSSGLAGSGPGSRGAFVPLAAGAPAAGPPSAVQGIDVAAFQHPKSAEYPQGAPISWAQVAGSGVRFAAIKATEGNYYANPFYGADLAGARAAGLAVIGYAFANPLKKYGSAAGQARYLVSQARAAGPVPPLMLDIEYNPYPGGECYGLTAPQLTAWVTQFENTAKALTGHLPIIYTTAQWWAACTGDTTALTAAPLWDAAYLTARDPPLPAGWTDWALWQYTSSGTVPGIAVSRTDLDALNLLSPGSQHAVARQQVTLAASQVSAGPDPGLSYRATGLPPGLRLSPDGQVSGIPAASLAAPAAVTITASWGQVLGTVRLAWAVTGPVTAVAPAARTSVSGAAADFAVPPASVPGGQPAAYTAAGLPPGTALSTAGQVTGWPAGPGRFAVTLRAADAAGDAGLATFTWTVTAAPGGGPAGLIRAGAPGRCLADPGAATAGGTRIGSAPCAAGPAQDWTLAQDGTLRIAGKCLSAGPRGFVTLAGCAAVSAGQRWSPGPAGHLVTALGGTCLTGPRSGGTAALRVAACSGGPGQQWTLPAGPVASQIPGGCLEDLDNSAAAHTGVQVWSCNGSAAQDFTAGPAGTIRIHGRCLEVNHTATARKFPVDLAGCTGAPAQRWIVSAAAGAPAGAGLWLRDAGSGACLTDPASPGATFAAHPAVITGPCSAADPGAAWRLR